MSTKTKRLLAALIVINTISMVFAVMHGPVAFCLWLLSVAVLAVVSPIFGASWSRDYHRR